MRIAAWCGRGTVCRVGTVVLIAATIVAASVQMAAGVATVAYMDGKVVLRKADGSGSPTYVTTHTTTNGIFFSPSGEKVALTEGRYDGAWSDILQVYDVSSKTLRTVYHRGATYSPHFETWSPNGRYFIWTRLGSSYGYKYDCSTKTSTRWLLGRTFRWSADGQTIAFGRGRQLWLQGVHDDHPLQLADLSGYVPSDDFEIEWADDMLSLRVGYWVEGDGWHVLRVDAATGAVAIYVFPPSDFLHKRARTGGWVLHTDEQPAKVRNSVPVEVTVGPNVPTVIGGDISSDGMTTIVTDWWGGAGQWNVYACTFGHAPTLLHRGFVGTVRPDPLLRLGTPDVPSSMHAGATWGAQGSFVRATASYPSAGGTRLVIQKRVSGRWVTYYYRPVIVEGVWPDQRYRADVRLGAGRWRVRASHPRDTGCPSVASAWKYVTATR